MRKFIDKGGLFTGVLSILSEVDPEGLLAMGASKDEYTPEARTIVRSIEAGRKITPGHVRDIWLVWFGCGRDSKDTVLEVLGDMPMRAAFRKIAKMIEQRVTRRVTPPTRESFVRGGLFAAPPKRKGRK